VNTAITRQTGPHSRILITRSPHQASELADALRAHDASPILIPTIELTAPTTYAPLDAALTHLDQFHWLLFTSANAVEAFHHRLSSMEAVSTNQVPQGFSLGSHRPAREGALAPGACFPSPGPKIAAIGPATARALTTIGLTPTLIPPQAVAESLATALLPHALQPAAVPGQATPTRFLLIRAEQARDHLPETLRAAGADVTIAPAYRTIIPTASVDQIQTLFADPKNHPDAITFTSSSTAENLFALLKSANLTLPPEILRASIGPITTQTLCNLGFPPQIEAQESTIPSLVEALKKSLGLKNQHHP
jgi:uroporphyrinogen-III synthase